MKELIAYILILIIALSTALSATPTEDFEQAVEIYNRGEYDSALTVFQAIRDSGLVSAELYYNLGNCYFKTDQRGLAVAMYMQAERLNPRDEDIKANLRFVRSLLRDKPTDSLQNPIWNFVKGSALYFRSSELTWFAFACFLLLILILIVWIYYREKKMLFIGIVIVLSFFIVTSATIVGINIKLNYETPRGVITSPEVQVLAGPGAIGEVRFSAHEGLTFKILDQESGYYEGLFANNLKGWVPIADVYEF
ncbi:MAG: hypothetical protein GF404_06740 [candidate division Zixibacteria bacterium]|nr:hypothetical protein [candidate division Zixibacteria bacterium]